MTAPSPGFLKSYACLLLALVSAGVHARAGAAQTATPDCREPQACRELALEARERGAYETFHDLAWRAVQTGRPNDPNLLYLLARAQALSGRRRDAVITLRRLAEAGIVTDAATDEDFRRVRELAEWQYIAALADRGRAVADRPLAVTAPASRPSAPVAAPTPSAGVRSALRVDLATVTEAARFSTDSFAPAGLAYDAASRRFLFGDRAGRRLFVVGEGSERTIDFVRAGPAGFDDVTAIAIDPKRGHLWVASTSAGGNGALHHLQLISGRALGTLTASVTGPMRVSDLAVAADGAVFMLDDATPRLLVLRPGATAIELVMPLTTPQPVSLTVDDNGRLGYVAHRDGITRLDLQARRDGLVTAADGIELAGFEYVRLHQDVLVGSQIRADGSRGLVRLQLNRDRRIVTEATLLEEPPPGESGATLATISGDDLYYLVAGRPEGPDASGPTNVRVRRVRLR